jgi:hypothetical protein
MNKLISGALALAMIAACGDDPVVPVTPDAGPQVDAYIPPPPPPPPPPPQDVTVTGQVTELGSYLAGTPNYVGAASVLMLGVSPLESTISADATGAYSLVAPANGQVVLFANKLGYNPSYNAVTTQSDNIADRKIYITSNDWLNAIATAHNVDLNNSFACHGPPDGGLDPADLCSYGIVVGRILDDGAAGNGTPRPVAGVAAINFSITGANAARWYTKGPYFLNPDGTPNPGSQVSIVENDGVDYNGGLYVSFVEVPVAGAVDVTNVQYQIEYNDQDTGQARLFGPQSVQVYRNYGVSWSSIYETGIAPPLPPGPLDFDSQIYPLFLPVNQGGFGCQGCHTDQTGVAPAGGMNLYGGPEAAYASLNPNDYPQRVNVLSPTDSYLLRRPLYEEVGGQDHPIFAFASPQDPAYQIISQWISQGGVRTADLPPVSFRNDIRPILYQSVANGGAGCYNCHVAGVNADTAPGGFYMGGTPEELYAELVNEAPTDNGDTGEAYRISRNGVVEVSLVLTNPLFGNAEPHPTKIYQSNLDTRYQLLYRWIAEGYVDDGL